MSYLGQLEFLNMAPVLGIEPRMTESKSVVLPITPHRIKNNRIVFYGLDQKSNAF